MPTTKEDKDKPTPQPPTTKQTENGFDVPSMLDLAMSAGRRTAVLCMLACTLLASHQPSNWVKVTVNGEQRDYLFFQGRKQGYVLLNKDSACNCYKIFDSNGQPLTVTATTIEAARKQAREAFKVKPAK